jgi:selenocysteine lyase/cysteine desulfurase
MERRRFLQVAGAGAAGALAGAGCASLPDTQQVTSDDASELARFTGGDDAFWDLVRSYYSPPTDYIDLDHANTAPTPKPVFNASIERARRLSEAPAERFGKMWSGELDAATRPVIARFLGADPRHVAFMANTTSAINAVLTGYKLAPGDEILVTDHEYPDMIETIRQRVSRDGITMQTAGIPRGGEERLDLVARVTKLITQRTKLLLISHVSAWSGEVLPVAEVTAAARSRGVAVLVDAAQSAGIIDVKFDSIGCDFLGASFHKGLGAPLPTGVLIMRPERVRDVWPPHPPSWDTAAYPMDVFEWAGTFNVAALASVLDALKFQEAVGFERKRARLKMLGRYWQDRVRAIPGVRLLTPSEEERWCGPAAFAIDGIESDVLAKHLRARYAIKVQSKAGRYSPFANAVRVSTGPQTTTGELDRLVAAIAEIARDGIRNES